MILLIPQSIDRIGEGRFDGLKAERKVSQAGPPLANRQKKGAPTNKPSFRPAWTATFAPGQRVPKPSQRTTHRMITHLLDPNALYMEIRDDSYLEWGIGVY